MPSTASGAVPPLKAGAVSQAAPRAGPSASSSSSRCQHEHPAGSAHHKVLSHLLLDPTATPFSVC